MADIFTVLRGGYRAAKGMKKGDQDKFLSRPELQALLRAAGRDPRKYGADARDLFFISGNFGLRCSEAIDLELGDFETLHLGYFRVRTLKRRGEIEDRVYTGARGAALLETLVHARKRAGYRARIFPFTSRTARYLFAFYAREVGLSPNISFHSLRHTAARMMLEATGNGDPTKGSMRIVNCFLRHKPTTTEIYTTPSPNEMTRAIEQKGIVE